MRRYRPFLLLGLAAIIAFSTSSVAYRWLRAQSTVTQAPVDDTSAKMDVAVATFDIAPGEVIHRHQEGVRRLHDLVWDPAVRRKYGAKRIVAAHDFADGAAHRLDVERTLQIDHERNVVDGAVGCELIEKPEALLRE